MLRLQVFLDAKPGAPVASLTRPGSASIFFLSPDDLRDLGQLVYQARDKLDARKVPKPEQQYEPSPAQVQLAQAQGQIAKRQRIAKNRR